MKHHYILMGLIVLAATLALAACSSPEPVPCPTAAPCPIAAPCPTAAPCPDCPECPTPVVQNVPFEAQWVGSPHADSEAEAFRHWDEDDPMEVPTSCAKCHSGVGLPDYLGVDGSAAGSVDNAAPVDTVISCQTCHNAGTMDHEMVAFPSGVTVTAEDASAVCMECHQGRASGVTVDTNIEELGLTEDVDTPNPELGFVNIHYFATAATLYGSQTMGGYQYAGQSYDYKNDHVAGYDTCIGCHNMHSLELRIEECAACHTGVASVEDIRNIRMAGSQVDYDGDGDIAEGISTEIDGLRELLLTAMQAYATEVVGTPIAYNAAAYPYFFIDADGDGEATEADTESYNAWTARLLKAGYNYQTASKDHGAYAHGGKYIIQLVYDSIEDLNGALSSPVDLSSAHRIDHGHFAGSEEAFRHWDADGEVEAGCARCHSATGLPLYLKEGVNISADLANGLNCATCHNDLTTFTRREVGAVEFPSGASLELDNPDSNLCLNCHQGRNYGAAVARLFNGIGEDEVSERLRVQNPHYFAAGATLFGSEAAGAFQYEGKEYVGRNLHVETFDTCSECHDSHALEVVYDSCALCHAGVESPDDLRSIRMDPETGAVDYDGDGDVEEGVAGEIGSMHEALYAAMQVYAADTVGTAIAYNDAAYPYFFTDTNANGVADPEESVRENGFASWTPRLLAASYNYMWVAKDPGNFAHNGDYILQTLYDSLEDLGAAGGMTRP